MATKKTTRAEGETVEDYIASKPKEHQRALRRVRTIVRQTIPDAEESVSYKIPTYKIGKRAVVYFAGWAAHFSLYPVTEAMVEKLADTLVRADYQVSKGTIRFAYAGSIPTHFIQRAVRMLAEENRAGPAKPKKKSAAKKTVAPPKSTPRKKSAR